MYIYIYTRSSSLPLVLSPVPTPLPAVTLPLHSLSSRSPFSFLPLFPLVACRSHRRAKKRTIGTGKAEFCLLSTGKAVLAQRTNRYCFFAEYW